MFLSLSDSCTGKLLQLTPFHASLEVNKRFTSLHRSSAMYGCVYPSFEEAISHTLSSTRTLLSTARRLRASVSDAEFAAHTARQRATAAQTARTAEDEGLLREALARLRGEPVELQVANALAQHAGLLPADQEPTDPTAPVPPLVEMTDMIHEKMLQTAMVSRHLVELAWISESQEPLSQGGVLASVSSDELVQSLMGEGGEGGEAHG